MPSTSPEKIVARVSALPGTAHGPGPPVARPAAARAIRRATVLLILAAYLGLAALYTQPLLRHAGSRIANDPYDPVLNASILWWNATVLPFSPPWWTPPHFYPSESVAAFTENLAGVSVIASPILWATGNPLLAYNVALFMTWPLSAFAAYLLVLILSRRHDAAFVAGLAFGFAPYRVGQISHIQVLSAYYFPLALAGLHMYLHDRRARWLALFGASWLLQSLANGYFMLFGGVLVAMWLLYFCSRKDAWRALPRVAAAWIVASLPLVPVMLQYQVVHTRYGLSRSLADAAVHSAEPWAWAQVSQLVWFWYPALSDTNPEMNLFPGATCVALVGAALVVLALRRRQRAETESRMRRLVRRASGLTAFVGAACTVAMLASGPLRLSVAGFTLRASTLDRLLLTTIAAGAVFVLLSRRTRVALARRSPLIFYVAATVVVIFVCMGPEVRLGRHALLDPAPYRLLALLPGFDGLRVPTRFWMLGAMCLAAAAGLSFAKLVPRRGIFRVGAVTLVLGGILLDGWTRGFTMAEAPGDWPAVEQAGRAAAIIELPLGPEWDAAATYRAVGHRRRVANGVSGYDPPHYLTLQLGLNARDPAVLLALASFGPIEVVVNKEQDPGGEIERYVRGIEGVEAAGGDGARSVYRLPEVEPQAIRVGERLDVASLRSSSNALELLSALDGLLTTTWIAGAQRAGEWIAADLGAAREVGAIVMALGDDAQSFPRQVAIEASADGTSWRTLWQGGTIGEALAAAVRSPREVPITFAFEPVSARFLRLRLLVDDPAAWKVAELRVHAPPGG